ncbi:aldo/keto reductase [bacterium]|nr:aldo/keto reductase [bacterium]
MITGIGYGCMGLSGIYGDSHDDQGIATLQGAADLGVILFDTADVYGSGHNETLLGRALGKRRGKLLIASKFGLTSQVGESRGVNGRPEYVHQAVRASLSRLGTDYLDLYYLHRVDPDVPIEDTVGAMAELVQQGLVRQLGLSEASAATIRRAASVHPIYALQSEWSLWMRDLEAEVVPTCRELGIRIVPWSPLGRGFLTHQLTSLAPQDYRLTAPRFQGENFQKNLEKAALLAGFAAEWGCTAAQVALAWLLHQGSDVVPIPGTRNLSRVAENLDALKLSLSSDQMQQLEQLFPPGSTAGERYPEHLMRTVNL